MYTSFRLSSFCGESVTQRKLYFFYMSSHDHNPNICSSQGAEKMEEMTNVKPFAIMFLSLFFLKVQVAKHVSECRKIFLRIIYA